LRRPKPLEKCQFFCIFYLYLFTLQNLPLFSRLSIDSQQYGMVTD